MLLEIISHTPTWVWGIFLLLLWLGLSQSVDRTVTLRRVIVLPIAMTGLSLHGTFSAFHQVPWSWVLWLAAAIATIAWFGSNDLPAGVRFDPAARLFHLPGSRQPMVLMLAIFCTRYVVGVVLAMHPELTQDPASAALVASIYGALSGVFIGRMARMLVAARTPSGAPSGNAAAWG